MIKEIKKQRVLFKVNDIINKCHLEPRGGELKLYSYKKNDFGLYHGIFRIYANSIIQVDLRFFRELGVHNDITEAELKKIIHERFITSNKI